jgi:sugar/nucleoside kinase (ribokinase family)
VSSRGEAAFVRDALAGLGKAGRAVLWLETRGGDGVAILRDGEESIVPASAVLADDTTGAGDTFLGGFLAAWRGGDARLGVEKGMAAARALLITRAGPKPRRGAHVV